MKRQFISLLVTSILVGSMIFGQGSLAKAETSTITGNNNKSTTKEDDTIYLSNSKEFSKEVENGECSWKSNVVRNFILTDDINAKNEIFSSCNTTIDLNGHTLTMSDNTGIYIQQQGQLTVKSSKKGGKINLNFTKNYQFKGAGITNCGTFVMESGTIHLDAYKAVLLNNREEGSVFINGGNLQFVGDDSIKDTMDCTQKGIANSGSLNISGGTLKMSGSNTYRSGIFNFEGSKTKISGGTIDIQGKYARGIFNMGTLSMSEGEILSDYYGIIQKGKFGMTGGKISSYNDGIFLGNCISTVINGGTIVSQKGNGLSYGSGDTLPIVEKGTIKGVRAVGSGSEYYYYQRSAKGKKIKCNSSTLDFK